MEKKEPMLRYKEYKEINRRINESLLGQTLTLGMSNPRKLGDEELDEMGMKMSMPMMMKKMKKPMPPMMGGEEDMEMDPSMGGEEDMEMDDEEVDIEDDDDVDDDDDMDDDDDVDVDVDVEDDEEAMPMPMKGKGIMGKAKELAAGAGMMHKGIKMMHKGMKEESEEDDPLVQEMCSKCKKMHKMYMTKKMGKKKMSMKPGYMKEESKQDNSSFLESLKRSYGRSHFDLNPDGSFKEEALLPPNDPNDGLEVSDEPAPGEVGYAPTGRIGGNFDSEGYTEWAEKYKRKK